MYRVELIDGHVENMDEEQLAHYAGIVKAFVLDTEELASVDFDDEVERLLALA